ncbi:28606_t:CDS:2 [Dentiscutata erythropus]|uniref:28606_t:CDS:1 n=1 Tax=Dentiscutata erythropus TaxID=1348616 RepID=A0A9N8W3C8_9GLOM|nr:28606_t:CDS:2 [Dentiscutata erythropus]
MTNVGLDTAQNPLLYESNQIFDDEHDIANENSVDGQTPYKDLQENKLSTEIQQCLLQTFSRNALIKFLPPPMDKEIARCFPAPMEGVENLGQHIMVPTLQSIKQGHQRTGDDHNNIFSMAVSTMVFNTAVSSG